MEIICFVLYSPFLIISIIQELIFWFYKVKIFDWNPETEFKYLKDDTKKLLLKKDGSQFKKQFWAEREEAIRNAPFAWKVYRFTIEFIGIFVGWNLIGFVVFEFSRVGFIEFKDIGNMWGLLFALLLGLIGIAGRIPVIIDSVQAWFKR